MRYVVCWYRGIMMYHRLCSMHITAVLLVLAPVGGTVKKLKWCIRMHQNGHLEPILHPGWGALALVHLPLAAS